MAALIRLRWTEDSGDVASASAGPWFFNSSKVSASMVSAAAFGNRRYGANTHWVETLRAEPPRKK